jgi:hypothetical protein
VGAAVATAAAMTCWDRPASSAAMRATSAARWLARRAAALARRRQRAQIGLPSGVCPASMSARRRSPQPAQTCALASAQQRVHTRVWSGPG